MHVQCGWCDLSVTRICTDEKQFSRYETKCARTKTSNRYEKDCTWHEKKISFDMKKILKKILRVRNKLYKYETIAIRV